MTIHLLMTDDHDLVRAGLVEYLGTASDIEVVGEMAEQIAFFPGPIEQNAIELILSDRERQVFHLFMDRKNIKAIIKELAISDKTVSNTQAQQAWFEKCCGLGAICHTGKAVMRCS